MKTKIGFTDEYLLAKLVEAAKLLGHSPGQNDLLYRLPGFPSRGAYRNHFGTFGNAMKKAGLPPIDIGAASPNFPRPKRFPKPRSERRCLSVSKKSHLKMRFTIFERDNFTCQYCGKTPSDGAKLVIDHIVPFSKGGKTILENLVTSCFECNIGKNDRLIDLNILQKNKTPAK